MKIVITSDQHWHLFKEFDHLTENGKSYRLSLYEKTHNFVRNYMQENGIINWVDAGDIFHSRESISVQVLDAIGKQLSHTKAIGIKQIFLKGNHDVSNKSGSVTSLNILSEYGEIIDKRCSMDLRFLDGVGASIHFIPWDESIDFVETVNKVKTNIIIAHRMLKGAKVNNTILEGESLEGLDYSKFDNVFCGHVHEFQKIQDNVYYVGSLISNNFNDKNQDKGFIVYDFNTKTFERVENPYSPKYKIINFESSEQLRDYKMRDMDPEIQKTIFYDFRIKLKKGEELPKIDEENLNFRITVINENKLENRLDFDDLLTPESLLQKYKKMNNLEENIYNVGKRILEECLG